jgi:glycosyltransferase involved in cell wall biosynthesis
MSEGISVVMPVFNSARFLPDALASIAAQTLPPHEVILVDGTSTDETPEIARRVPNGRYLRQTGNSMWNALNEGVDAARGDYVAFLSDDDLWHAGKLRLQAEWLDAHPETTIVFAHARFELIPGESIPESFRPELLDQAFPAYMTETLLARREVFDVLGKFSEDYFVMSDMDWYARLFDANISTHMLDDVLLTKRVHADNLSSTATSAQFVTRELPALLRRSILRKRSARQSS